jgi:hypothetical protein
MSKFYGHIFQATVKVIPTNTPPVGVINYRVVRARPALIEIVSANDDTPEGDYHEVVH